MKSIKLMLEILKLLPAYIWYWLLTVYMAIETRIGKWKANLYHNADGRRYYVWRDENNKLYVMSSWDISCINRRRKPENRISIEKILKHKIYMTP